MSTLVAFPSSTKAAGPQPASFSYFHFNPAIHSREKPFEILINLPSVEKDPSFRRTNEEFEERQFVVADVRGREGDFSLDKNGVCWRTWEGPQECLGFDAKSFKAMGHDWIRAVYVKQAEEYIRKEIQKQDGKPVDIVKVFDYKLRTSSDMKDFSKRTLDLDDGLDTVVPVTHPHVDQSFDGAITRIQVHMGNDADRLQQRRFRIVNVWKPLRTVTNWPLAICDSASVSERDLIPADLVRRKYVGETFYASFNEEHKWHYLSNQKANEVTMLKIHDSLETAAVRYSLHSSFKLVGTDEGEIRESFEVRALVFDLAD